MRIGSHEYANEADDNDDVPKPAQSLGTPVPRQKWEWHNKGWTKIILSCDAVSIPVLCCIR